MSILDVFAMLISFVLGVLAATVMFVRGLLFPPRKSETDKVVERIKNRIDAQKKARESSRAVAIANDIIVRN